MIMTHNHMTKWSMKKKTNVVSNGGYFIFCSVATDLTIGLAAEYTDSQLGKNSSHGLNQLRATSQKLTQFSRLSLKFSIFITF